MLEGSKKFAKEFMTRQNIPTAKFMNVTLNDYEKDWSSFIHLNHHMSLRLTAWLPEKEC